MTRQISVCSTRRINSGLSASAAFRAFILNVLLEREAKDGLNETVTLKVRQDSRVINKSVFLALGINIEGQKELLGMWLAENEGAKFWLNVLTELKNRGLNDILIACVDGLKGFPDAINTLYPKARIQLCIVHMVRNSLRFVSWKDYKAVTRDLKAIYQAPTEDYRVR